MSDSEIAGMLEDGERALAQGRWADAAVAFERVRQLQADHPQALHGLGCASFHLGQGEFAIKLLREACELAPQLPLPWHSLGAVLSAMHRADEAMSALSEALRLQPCAPETLLVLARVLLSQGEGARAASAYIQAAEAHLKIGRPDMAIRVLSDWATRAATSGPAHYELGTLLAKSGHAERARFHLQLAVQLRPEHGPSWCNLALVMEEATERAAAIEALRHAVAILPESEVVRFHLAALGECAAPEACPVNYLIPFFNEYALRFDKHLVDQLAYSGPSLLMEAVRFLNPSPPLDILDLGCGTGLCGELFKPLASRLIGVDLAPKMVDIAEKRGVYDKLIVADIVSEMTRRHEEFDLILAADVFIYIGDLRPAFDAAYGAIRPGGLFVFTLETAETADYVLRPTRRYAQSLRYVRSITSSLKWQEAYAREATLRQGEGVGVKGVVVALRKQPQGPQAHPFVNK